MGDIPHQRHHPHISTSPAHQTGGAPTICKADMEALKSFITRDDRGLLSKQCSSKGNNQTEHSASPHLTTKHQAAYLEDKNRRQANSDQSR